MNYKFIIGCLISIFLLLGYASSVYLFTVKAPSLLAAFIFGTVNGVLITYSKNLYSYLFE